MITSEPEPRSLRQLRRDRLLRRLGLTALALLVLAGVTGLLGTREGTASASGGGYRVTVEHPAVTRPGHAVPLSFEVRREGGFDGEVVLRFRSAYFDLFDENAFDPTPVSHTSGDDVEEMAFEPPDGDVLTVSVDTRVEPARQDGESGWLAVVGDGGREVVRVEFRTRVLP